MASPVAPAFSRSFYQLAIDMITICSNIGVTGMGGSTASTLVTNLTTQMNLL